MRQLFSIIFFLVATSVFSQKDNFLWPLNQPITLSGNYGELRPSHFHAGIDFGTNGKINLPVYAAQSGYVSRIRVSSSGYGKSIYITHPNGKVTVYAHLNNYVATVSAFVKQEQIKRESFEIELFPMQNEFKFTAGDMIAYSGNTGNSTGPHLHFEIRDELTEVPLNAALFYKIEDNVKPIINRIGLYNLTDTASPKFIQQYEVKSNPNGLKLKEDSITISNSIIGFSFSGFDKFTTSGSKNNIYKVIVKMDGKVLYQHELNNVAFSETRYVNEFSDIQGKFKFQKCFLPNLHPSGLYKNIVNKGRMMLLDTNYHLIQVLACDENGNENELEFYLRTKKFNYYSMPSIKGDTYAYCTKDLLYCKKGIQIFIPKNTLYNSTPLIFENTLQTTGKLIVLPSEANLSSAAIVGFEVPKKYRSFKTKLLFKNADNVYLPIVKRDSVFYAVKNFGWFNLAVDTVAPTIKTEVAAQKLAQAKKLTQVTFILKEELSGLKEYRLTINSSWALAEYDGKSGRLTYYFDDSTPKGNLEFVVMAKDNCLNQSSYSISLKN